MDPFIGEIRIFAGNFAPRDWAFCQGQLLSIASNTALFSLLGTYYGGDGRTTFGLPDLRGRAPVNYGQGPGLTDWVLGEMFGDENQTVLLSQLPAHNHSLLASNASPDSGSPAGHYLAAPGREAVMYSTGSATGTMSASMIQPAGGSQPFSTRPPYLGINYIIALAGVYPSRP
jgi:microcystin-dependent protein